jgi:hypothetical protein
MKPLNKRTDMFTKYNLNMRGKFDPCDPKAFLDEANIGMTH